MDEIVNKFNFSNELNEEIRTNMKFLHVFRDFSYPKENVLLITNEDTVYCFGRNRFGVLGFGHESSISELTKNEQLSNKQIIDFKHGEHHVIACNSDGKLYCWGRNRYLGTGKNNDEISEPKLNENLANENIIDFCCGRHHTLVLTSNKEVLAWGRNDKGQIGNQSIQTVIIPFKVKDFDGENVKSISCGSFHSMALTESGRAYTWGNNLFGQLGINDVNNVQNNPIWIQREVVIEKISCGPTHSLLLSREKDIYVFGWNKYRQLGIKTDGLKIWTPIKLKISEKFKEIVSHYDNHISTAYSENGLYYIWGKCGKQEIIMEPKETQFKSFHEMFVHNFQITYKTLGRLEESQKNLFSLRNQKYERDFREIESIAQGYFGVVFRVSDTVYSSKLFAVKKIPLDVKKGKFCEESNIMAKLNNKFVVTLFDVWIETNYYLNRDSKSNINPVSDSKSSNTGSPVYDPYKPFLLHIQMELCYKNLREIIGIVNDELNGKELKELSLLGYYISSEIFKELVECLNYLHSRTPPIIHRDLKPENILISYGKDGRFVKLADFGLAVSHISENQSHTQGSGTRSYMAPEVQKSRNYGPKADIYSLGLITIDLFNIYDNESSRNLSLKRKNIEALIKKMKKYSESKRPTCDQILDEKESWEMKAQQLIEEKKLKLEEVNSIEKCFYLYFIQTKLKKYKKETNSSLDKCIIT